MSACASRLVAQRAGWARSALVVLSACSGSGSPEVPTTPAPMVRVAEGRVSSVGAFAVAGLRFAGVPNVLQQGAAVPAGVLAPGQQVEVRGSIAFDGQSGAAGEVVIRGAVRGPVEQAFPATARPEIGAIVVLGQRVRIDDDTLVVPGMLIDASLVRREVDVHGERDPVNGVIRATRISFAQPGDGSHGLSGPVASVDGTDGSFVIGGLRVDVAGARLNGFAASGVAAGDWVEVVARGPAVAGVLPAIAIERLVRGFAPNTADPVALGGLIDAFAGVGSFRVAGQNVNAGAAIFSGGLGADLANGVRVDVRGRVISGTLEATAVTVHLPVTVEWRTSIQSVDAAAGRLRLESGQFVDVPTGAALSDASDAGPALAGLASISPTSDDLRIRAHMLTGGMLVANVIERVPRRAAYKKIRGPIDAATLQGPAVFFTVAGQRVEGQGVVYQDWFGKAIGPQAFFAAAALGSVVEAEGSFPTSDSVILATTARLVSPVQHVVGMNEVDFRARVFGETFPGETDLLAGSVAHLLTPFTAPGIPAHAVYWDAPPEVWGKVTAVTPGAEANLHVLYQPVVVDETTVHDAGFTLDPASVVAKSVVEVQGFRDFDRGRVYATLVGARNAFGDRTSMTRGIVRGVDTTTRRFYLNDLLVYNWVDNGLVNPPADGVVRDGMWVRAEQRRVREDDALEPFPLEFLDAGVGAGEGDALRLEGIVGSVVSDALYSVGSQRVDAGQAVIDGVGIPRVAASGDRVVVSGRMRFGTLMADRVQFRR